jgi:translation initiation factor IF-3
MQLKEIKMRPKIDDHDYGFKVNHAREFLNARDKVKLTIMFRGRELARMDTGRALIDRAITELSDISTVESSPRAEGKTLTAVLMPKPTKAAGKTETARDGAAPPRHAQASGARPEPAKE